MIIVLIYLDLINLAYWESGSIENTKAKGFWLTVQNPKIINLLSRKTKKQQILKNEVGICALKRT